MKKVWLVCAHLFVAFGLLGLVGLLVFGLIQSNIGSIPLRDWLTALGMITLLSVLMGLFGLSSNVVIDYWYNKRKGTRL